MDQIKRKKLSRPNNLHPAEEYAWDIKEGVIISCEWIKCMVDRYFRDMERSEYIDPDFPYYFNYDKAVRAISFFSWLKHSKGEWAGQPFEPSPWEQFITWQLFGWVHDETDLRRFRTCYLEVARKNGKTTFVAGTGLYLFDGDQEPGAEVYSAATKFDQAKLSHGEAMRMVKSSPFLRDHIKCHVNNIFSEHTNSIFRPLGRDHDTLDGLNVHAALVDELHAHKTRDIWDVLETATGARRQPLVFAITTAGFNRETICYEVHSYAQKVLEGSIVDETFLGIIYTLDEEDDWKDESNWIKANPNLHVSVKIDDLRRKAIKAAEIPTAQNAFLRLHTNVWTESETRWIPHDTWMGCGNNPIDESQFKGRLCCGGLDLSSNKDISAFILVFPPENTGDPYDVLCRFFIPKDNIRARVRRDRVPYDAWVSQGLVTATPGKVINYKYIIDKIDEDAHYFDIKEIAFDRWGATKIVQDLEELGFIQETEKKKARYAAAKLIGFGQGYMSMSAPMKELENLILSTMLNHGGNPVLAWMASNIVASEDPAGNIKPDKKKSIEKIDGIVALIMGLDRALRLKNYFEVAMPTGI
jgi:phage terminase large subunit-like protein